jgi:hypothetical protein
MTTVNWCAAMASMLFVSMAYAQADTPVIDQRQVNQERRIDHGVVSGVLTEREAKRMADQQQQINRMEDKAKSDGVVTKKEKARLHKAQDRASRHIARQKHDRQEVRRR